MAYEPTTWVNGSTPALNSTNLNKIESGMEAVHDAVAAIEAQSINAQTGTTYTIVLTDVGKIVTCSNAAAITVTLPQDSAVAVPVGTRIDFIGISTGLITFANGTGATVNGTPTLTTRAQWSAATAIKRAADTWIVVGDLA